MSGFERELEVLTAAVTAAGRSLIRAAQKGFTTSRKGNCEPVTSADLEANRILHEILQSRFPEYGWLSEETKDDRERLTRDRVWIVDPVDGTNEFIAGIPEFAVSVALTQRKEPILAAVYNPMRDELFTAIRGLGAACNGEPIRTNAEPVGRLRILASRSEVRRGEFEPFFTEAEVVPTGSIAYKLALIAAGRGDATFSLGPKNEWDIVAGVLLVQEAGGWATDKIGRPFCFNRGCCETPVS